MFRPKVTLSSGDIRGELVLDTDKFPKSPTYHQVLYMPEFQIDKIRQLLTRDGPISVISCALLSRTSIQI